MDGLQPVAVDTRQNLIKINLALKANIYDIYHCEGPPEVLEKLNAHGRRLIADFRRLTHDLEFWAKEEDFKRNEEELLAVLNNCREQLLRETHLHLLLNVKLVNNVNQYPRTIAKEEVDAAKSALWLTNGHLKGEAESLIIAAQDQALATRTTAEFKKANIACLQAIERSNKAQLLHSEIDSNTQLKNRTKKDKVNLIKKSTNITDRLLSISRHLAETIEQNSKTLDSLVISSSNVTGIRDELRSTGSVINQSGKLVRKYDQREFTSKLMIFAGFALFLAVCLSIVYNRLF
ncbi:vesicle transport protein SEC20 isoform X4 [Bemisia tabaci]|uniref:vesicle transport protein SEC20 isoform X4 n=1 Tax=Bemisia tabaci TaxID=7038 RepID=UPI003B287DE9